MSTYGITRIWKEAKTQQILFELFGTDSPYIARDDMEWAIFCESKVWFMLHFSQCSIVGITVRMVSRTERNGVSSSSSGHHTQAMIASVYLFCIVPLN